MPEKRLHGTTRRCDRLEPLVSGECPPCSEGHNLFCSEAWVGIAEMLRLSSRQVEVVRCVLAGQSDDEIASALSLERATIRTHMERLHERLHARNRIQLATRILLAYRDWYSEASPPPGCPLQNRLAGT
jgi:DNA-binding CsgD family transcriptional regulator